MIASAVVSFAPQTHSERCGGGGDGDGGGRTWKDVLEFLFQIQLSMTARLIGLHSLTLTADTNLTANVAWLSLIQPLPSTVFPAKERKTTTTTATAIE